MNQGLKEWVSAFQNSPDGKYALSRLEKLEGICPSEYPWLVNYVLEACYLAKTYDKKGDPGWNNRSADSQIKKGDFEAVTKAVRDAKSLRSFLLKYQNQISWNLFELPKSIPSQQNKQTKVPPVHRLAGALDALIEDLSTQQVVSQIGPLDHRTRIGCFEFKDPIDKRRMEFSPQVGLLFNLVLYFRRWTGCDDPGSFAMYQNGEPMPTYGAPNYNLAAALIRAVFGVDIDAADRLKKYIKRYPGVCMGSWPHEFKKGDSRLKK